MEDTAKYLVHADVVADGVVERSDVVGAIFGQTEGLLGDELDLRGLQRASKVGRINVEIDSENGQSFGQVTIASSLDRVETAILAAALETIDRVGPCRSNVAVSRIEDVRAAKRREVVERAKSLIGQFDESVLSTRELVEEVRRSVRVEDITEYEGLPAGPRVGAGDAIIVVEGRADVLTLLRYGIKNAIAVEGTNVPEPVADLTAERTVTAFLDGDRGGDLILKELAQVGKIDYVAIAPSERSVEDLTRREALAALRGKVPYTEVAAADSPREALAAAEGPQSATDSDVDGSERSDAGSPIDPRDVAPPAEITGVDAGTSSSRSDVATASAASETAVAETANGAEPTVQTNEPARSAGTVDATEATSTATSTEPTRTTESTGSNGTSEGSETNGPVEPEASAGTTRGADDGQVEESAESLESVGPDEPPEPDEPSTLHGHVRAVAGTGRVRVLDADFATLAAASIENAFDAIANVESDPAAVVLDGEVTQRLVDIAAQRGVEQVVAREEGSFVKQPTSVRVRTVSQLQPE